jgi:hypothetical protein
METAEIAMETDGDGSRGTSSSRQGAGTETYVPRNSSAATAELWNYSGKLIGSLGFSCWEEYIGGRAASGGGPGGLTTRGHGPGAERATLGCGWPVAPSVSSSVFWKLR